MLLKKLIKNLPKEYKKISIQGLAVDSKKIKKGFIFFAIKGNKFNDENHGTLVKRQVWLLQKKEKKHKKNLLRQSLKYLLRKRN